MTALQIFEQKKNPIALMNPAAISVVLEFAIIDLMNFVNVPRTMNEFQIKETAKLILQKFSYLTIPDIKLVFDRIKLGQVKLYEGLDGQKILGAFESWAEERWRAADEKHFTEHLSIKESREPESFYEENKPESFKEIADENWFKKRGLG